MSATGCRRPGAGDRVPAIDAGGGRTVFAPTGSTQWHYTAVFAGTGTLVVSAWIVIFPVMTLIHRRS
jgi:hypothetical protein